MVGAPASKKTPALREAVPKAEGAYMFQSESEKYACLAALNDEILQVAHELMRAKSDDPTRIHQLTSRLEHLLTQVDPLRHQ